MFIAGAKNALIRGCPDLDADTLHFVEVLPFPDRNKPTGKEDIEGQMYVFTISSGETKIFTAFWNGMWMIPHDGLFGIWKAV